MEEKLKEWLRSIYEATFSFANPQWYYWWLGAAGIILVLIIMWRIKRSRRNFRVFRDESGVAETTNAALRDLVRIACDGVETASKPRIDFKKKHGRINVQIRAKLYQGQRLGEVRDQMRRRVTQIFQDTHGILIGDVSFTATGFKKSNHMPEVTPLPEPVSEKPTPEQIVPVEPLKEPEPEKKSAFGWSTPKEPEGLKPIKEESKPEPEIEEQKNKKTGLFGGFGGKKSEPEIIEESKQEDLLADDEFSALLSENDEDSEKKRDDKI
ncbi:hypothetical protein [Cerasicoccus arenae]|uniref:Alkaline shock response membrane anchor protein AmaP n=1 Tax=Cerasicoccus arenae TaxID=424488 RepID=A0A8J3GEB0_9BACT|nr:hypothetical protein [Cerasicoccus arenae]MBK1858402.1 hypothetical protein [Cerasicoccus arenae]GHC02309.1 hypothetical protein GCM10007047_18570 [Cerasicoccus arenae]